MRRKSLPLSVRLAKLKLDKMREKHEPPPLVPCVPGDSVIVAINGRYRNGEVVEAPWFSNDRYKRVRLDDGQTVRLGVGQVVQMNEAV